MELTQLENNKKRDLMNIIFLVCLVIAICALLFLIVWLVRYEQVLTNPLGYNLAQFNISSCSYLDDNGRIVIINATR
jgi:flagellar basal body-associated protein FliL